MIQFATRFGTQAASKIAILSFLAHLSSFLALGRPCFSLNTFFYAIWFGFFALLVSFISLAVYFSLPFSCLFQISLPDQIQTGQCSLSSLDAFHSFQQREIFLFLKFSFFKNFWYFSVFPKPQNCYFIQTYKMNHSIEQFHH